VENVAPTASALEPINTPRREICVPFIASSSLLCFFRPREIFVSLWSRFLFLKS
jgi:hypothetical protein